MKLQILGTGCSRCKTLISRVEEAISALGVNAEIEKIEDIEEIVKFGVMSTPALAMNGRVLFVGRVPTTKEISDLVSSIETE